jgi:hypothetical protein
LWKLDQPAGGLPAQRDFCIAMDRPFSVILVMADVHRINRGTWD